VNTVKFDLNAGEIASYEWGSLLARFSPFAQVNGQSFVKNLHLFSRGIAVWTTNPELRETASFLHETVHYLQDLLTGIGCWDYLVRREYLPQLFTQSRLLSWIPDLALPYITRDSRVEQASQGQFVQEQKEKATQLLSEMIDQCLFIPETKLSPGKRLNLLNKVSAECICSGGQALQSGDESSFLVEAMLEGEAAITVYSQIRSAGMNEEQHEIATQNDSILNPVRMPSVYSKTLMNILGVVRHIFGSDATADHPAAVLEISFKLLLFLTDLSTAHPSPRLLARISASASDYDPGLKLARLLIAFQNLPERQLEDFLDNLMRHQFMSAEKILLSQSDYRYLRVNEVYEDWRVLFSDLASTEDDRVLALRRDACTIRVEKPNDCVIKGLPFIVEHRIPLFFLTEATPESGIESIVPEQYLLPDERDLILMNLVRENRDLKLLQYFYETGIFVCPLVEANVCAVSTDICRSGITRNHLFPASRQCTVYRSLQQGGWFMFEDPDKYLDSLEKSNNP
jgi:hypothetical protein